jgi:hypothetical protein
VVETAVVGLRKAECIDTTGFDLECWKSLTDVEVATAESVESFDNRRVHSTFDYGPPAAVEEIYYYAQALDGKLGNPVNQQLNSPTNPGRFTFTRTRDGGLACLRADVDELGPLVRLESLVPEFRYRLVQRVGIAVVIKFGFGP